MGAAITVPAVKNGHDITLVGTPLDKEIIEKIKTSKIHPNLNIELENTKAINSEELKQDDFDIADVIIIGVSSKGIDWFIDLLKKFKNVLNVKYEESIEKAIRSIPLEEGDLIIITGSLYLAGEVLNLN